MLLLWMGTGALQGSGVLLGYRPPSPPWATGSWARGAWARDSWGVNNEFSAVTPPAPGGNVNRARRRRTALLMYRAFRAH